MAPHDDAAFEAKQQVLPDRLDRLEDAAVDRPRDYARPRGSGALAASRSPTSGCERSAIRRSASPSGIARKPRTSDPEAPEAVPFGHGPEQPDCRATDLLPAEPTGRRTGCRLPGCDDAPARVAPAPEAYLTPRTVGMIGGVATRTARFERVLAHPPDEVWARSRRATPSSAGSAVASIEPRAGGDGALRHRGTEPQPARSQCGTRPERSAIAGRFPRRWRGTCRLDARAPATTEPRRAWCWSTRNCLADWAAGYGSGWHAVSRSPCRDPLAGQQPPDWRGAGAPSSARRTTPRRRRTARQSRASRASPSASRSTVRPRPSSTSPRRSALRSTRLTVAREVPASAARSSWMSGMTIGRRPAVDPSRARARAGRPAVSASTVYASTSRSERNATRSASRRTSTSSTDRMLMREAAELGAAHDERLAGLERGDGGAPLGLRSSPRARRRSPPARGSRARPRRRAPSRRGRRSGPS